MGVVSHFLIGARRLMAKPEHELSRWQQAARFMLDLSRFGARKLHHDRAAQMAAALTYHTLFSILPMLALMLVVLSVFIGPDERQNFKDLAVEYLVGTMEVDSPPEEHRAPAAVMSDNQEMEADARAAEEDAARLEFQQMRQRLDEHAEELLNALETINFGSIGAVGVLVFIYGATALLATTERSFNTIFGIEQGRPWLLRIPLYFTTTVLAPVMLIAAQVMQLRLFHVLETASWTKWTVGPLAFVAPLAALWLLLFLLYVLMPRARVSTRAALIGSFIAAVGMSLSKELFRLYVGNAGSNTLYGAMGLLPLFLLWLFLTWLIVLFGLEITSLLQAMGDRTTAEMRYRWAQQEGDRRLPLDPAWSLAVLIAFARAFAHGKALTPEQTAESLDLPPAAVRALCHTLHQSGLLHHLAPEDEGDEERFALARAPSTIPLDDYITQTTKPVQAQTASDRLHQAQREAMKNTTLADIM